jgi:hypothetical protein
MPRRSPATVGRSRAIHLGQQGPRSGELDGEDGQPVLTDFAEWFSRLRELRLVAAKRSGDGRATAIRIERDRDEPGDGLTRK